MKKILYLCFLILSFGLYSQNQANIWYFGYNAGLDFGSGSPVALLDGQIHTTEGCATLSDSSGNLLFYTDGITVWDRNHNIMPNGTGLKGDDSSTQSAIIVPKPDDSDIFYIFTVDREGGNDGLMYSEVDLTRNGGMGNITSNKNIKLATPVLEKVTAVQHADGERLWVISHKYRSNEFIAYLVDSTGINTTPVISKIGAVVNGNVTNQSTIGYLKASPDGSKLGIVHHDDNRNVQLFDFNDATGAITNLINFDFKTNNSQNIKGEPYGIEFSPNSQVLYISEEGGQIFQYDLSSQLANVIKSSRIKLSNTRDYLGALQLAPDGKIYVAKYNKDYLGAIQNPDILGNGASYVEHGADLKGRNSRIGLPPFIQSYFRPGIDVNDVCVNEPALFEVNSSETIESIHWDFGEGTTSNEIETQHIYNQPGVYTITATITANGITKTLTDEIEVFAAPNNITIPDQILCDDASNDGFVILDISSIREEFATLANNPDLNFTFHQSLADAQNNINSINQDPQVSDGQIIFVRIFNADFEGCTQISSFAVHVNPQPIVSRVEDIITCSPTTLNLESYNDDLLGIQNANDFNITYHLSQNEAFLGNNPLPNNYNINGSGQFFVRIESAINPLCYDTTSINYMVGESPIANTINDSSFCTPTTANFLDWDTQILGIQNTSQFNTSYHWNQNDANSGANPLITTEQITETTTLFARIESINSNTCYDITTFTVTITTPPQAQNVEDIVSCSPDSVNLNSLNTSVLGNQDAANYTITYHPSQQDANSDQNALPDYFDMQGSGVLFARIESVANNLCYDTTTINYTVGNAPIAYSINDETFCAQASVNSEQWDAQVLGSQNLNDYLISYHYSQSDADTGINAVDSAARLNQTTTLYARIESILNSYCFNTTLFTINITVQPEALPITDVSFCSNTAVDLTQFNSQVIGEQSLTNYEVFYFISLQDAQSNINALPEFYNLNGEETIYTRIQSRDNTNCYDIGDFKLINYIKPQAFKPNDIYVCDDEFNSGLSVFDLEPQTNQILNNQAGNHKVTYHSSEADALANANPLSDIYENTNRNEIIWARIENTQSPTCFDITNFSITVRKGLEPKLENQYLLCDQDGVILNAGVFDAYYWSTGEDTQEIELSQAGEYSLTVINEYPEGSCASTIHFTVRRSESPVITELEVSDWTANTNSITVHAFGTGIYEYSLDGFEYQESPAFDNLNPGIYTVFARDISGCAVASKEAIVMFYPKYFTPNADGYHDYWQIIGSSNEPNSKIYIFDRYGKLLKQLDPLSSGWDGTYNGANMPSTDYWFLVERENGENYKGHFTLIRR